MLLAFYLLLLHKPVEDKAGEMVGENMGRPVAELILANGERIALDEHSRHIQEGDGVKIVNDSIHRLVYDGADTGCLEVEAGELEFNTVKVPAGADYMVCLSDGTVVRLNCETEFRYPVRFSKGERRVYLNGEAFLKSASRRSCLLSWKRSR